jgi:hypothetical protein
LPAHDAAYFAQRAFLLVRCIRYATSPDPVFSSRPSGFRFRPKSQTSRRRPTAQNALFDEQYESDLGNFPERATAFGDYRYNDKLGDRSLDAIARFHKSDEAFLTRLEAIPTTGFSDQDQLSHDLLNSCPPADASPTPRFGQAA